jgi:lipopolysaccharide exporter
VLGSSGQGVSQLERKMAKGAAWLILFRLADRSIGFVSTLILARILVPGDFGLVAMVTALLAALELLGAFSFDLALIQNQQAQRRHYDTVWTFSVAFGIFKALTLSVLATPMASFFAEARLEMLVYAVAFCTFVQGLDNVGVVSFQKDLQLHKEFWFSLYRRLIGFAVTIVLAILLRNYWALVGGMLATRLASVFLSYIMSSYRPRFSLGAAAELFNYSKWLLLNNFLIFINNRGMDFVIGKISGAQSLGLYSVAYEIANLPTTELVWPIQRAVFPGYAQLAQDLTVLGRAFLQVIGLVALLTVPAGALIGLAAEPFVLVLLGPKWLGAVPLIQVLAAFGIVRSLHGPTGSIYVAIGKPRTVALFQCVQLLIAFPLASMMMPAWGVVGAAWAIFAGATAAAIINYVILVRELPVTPLQIVSVVWRSLAGMIGMALAIAATRLFEFDIESRIAAGFARLITESLAGLIGYVTVVYVAWRACGKPDTAEAQAMRIVGEWLPWLQRRKGQRR